MGVIMTDAPSPGHRASDREANFLLKWWQPIALAGSLLVVGASLKNEVEAQARINDQQQTAIATLTAQQQSITLQLTQLSARADSGVIDARRTDATVERLDTLLRSIDNRLSRIEERLGTTGRAGGSR
jgi:hypothetical protein